MVFGVWTLKARARLQAAGHDGTFLPSRTCSWQPTDEKEKKEAYDSGQGGAAGAESPHKNIFLPSDAASSSFYVLLQGEHFFLHCLLRQKSAPVSIATRGHIRGSERPVSKQDQKTDHATLVNVADACLAARVRAIAPEA